MPPENERPLYIPYIDVSKANGDYEWKRIDKSTVFEFAEEPKEYVDENSYYPNVDTEERTAEIEVVPNVYSMLSQMEEIEKNPEIEIRRFPKEIDTNTFDKMAEFSVRHDGTLLFILQCFEYCIAKMMQESDGTPYIGGVEEISEFDLERKKFVPKDKPWCAMQTTYRIYYTNKEPECR